MSALNVASSMIDRLPPHSVNAEQCLLGALLFAGTEGWDTVSGRVAEADFYRDDHRRIFRVIAAMHGAGKTVDVVTVFDALSASNEESLTGGLAYLAEMASSTPSSANIAGYAAIVADKAMRRRLIAVSSDIERLAYANDGHASDAIEKASGLVFDLASGGRCGSREPMHIAEVIGRAVAQIESRIGKGHVFGMPTGFYDIDAMTGGLHAGDLIIVAGRPSMGKTAISINIAEHAALNGSAVLVFSLEMADTQIAMRNLASVASASIERVRSGAMTEDEWVGITEAMGRFYETRLWVDDAGQLSAAQMHARARRVKRQHGLDLIVIDYLQLMQGDGNNRTEQLGDITRRLKLMARDLGVPVMLLSQLSRKVEERNDKRPMMSDLRESGSIEQDADMILMVYRDDYYNQESPWAGFAEVNLVKNRMGQIGRAHLLFEGVYSRFRNAAPDAVANRMKMTQSTRENRAAPRRLPKDI